jgi:hypothetical protein
MGMNTIVRGVAIGLVFAAAATEAASHSISIETRAPTKFVSVMLAQLALPVVSEQEISKELAILTPRYKQFTRENVATWRVDNFIYLFTSFDSKFWPPPNNQKLFLFRNRAIIGSDLNYYFQGVIFKHYGISEAVMIEAIHRWKQFKHGDAPSDNALWAARQGYAEEGRSKPKTYGVD